MPQTISYADSGVDIGAGDRAVDLIKDKAQETLKYFPGRVLSGIGGFSGIVELPSGQVMGSCTDGVGTKLVLSILMDKHDTVGIDLVAMSVNDLIVAGISPAVFLDYIAMGKQIPERTKEIVNGIIEGCHQSETALMGGEMAEMPGLYRENDYDLAGFAIGFADNKEKLILGKEIRPGMKVYGLASTGVHSNGYSLVRKVFGLDLDKAEEAKKTLNESYPSLGRTLGEALLEPTKIYVKELKNLIARYKIRGMAHITGGGLIENVPRVLPVGCAVNIKRNSWEIPAIFKLIQEKGHIPELEMMRTFNYGIGLVLISEDVIPEATLIGEVVKGNQVVTVID